MNELLRTGIYQLVEGKHGRFLANPQDLYMGRALIRYGEFSEQEWNLLDQLLRPGMVAIEAGANMGALTVPMARKIGVEGLLYAFEPQLVVFQQLCANLALNDLVNVPAFNAGCGEASDWMSTIRPDPRTENNFGGYSLQKLARDTPIKIRVERLDDAVDPPRLDLIKADVEGMETEVLKGAAGLIAKFRPLFYLEANKDDAPGIIEHVLSLDYEAWWHLPLLFNPDNHLGVNENLFGNITSKNILCAPVERKLKVGDARKVTGPEDHPAHWGART